MSNITSVKNDFSNNVAPKNKSLIEIESEEKHCIKLFSLNGKRIFFREYTWREKGNETKSNKLSLYLNKEENCPAIKYAGYVLEANCFHMKFI